MTDLDIDIFNEKCKNGNHSDCSGHWNGLGLMVGCNCVCHNNIIPSKNNDSINANKDWKNDKNLSKSPTITNSIILNQQEKLASSGLLTKSFEGSSQQTQSFMES